MPYTKASRSKEISERELRNRQLAYTAACESAVMLKNEGVLPFTGKKIAAFGAGVAHTEKGGTGSGEVNERGSVSILDGLENRGFTVSSRCWLSDYDKEYYEAYRAFQKEKKPINPLKLAQSVNEMMKGFQSPDGRAVTEQDIADSAADECIYVVSRQAGEGGDRRKEKGDYLFTDKELADIRLCAEKYKKFALIINSGSGMDMLNLSSIKGIGAILYICQLGTEGGNAVADILAGTVNPSGKLTDTWAKAYSAIPYAKEYSYLNKKLKTAEYKEGIYVGYRYFDSFDIAPLYPFGFGLSYTKFSISSGRPTVEGSRVTLSVKVKNTGRVSGKETVQLYVTAPMGRLNKEYQSLRAFAKTKLLAPGESQELTLSFDLRDAASYHSEEAAFILEAGDYILRVGNSSRNTSAAGIVRLDGEAVVSRHDNICGPKKAIKESSTLWRKKELLNKLLPVTEMSAAAVETVVYRYETDGLYPDGRVRNFVDKLSVKEMAEIVVGTGMSDGKSEFRLPGAAGNTSSAFWDRGLANVALCDGPAGLRIKQSFTLEKGGETLYQYATAFPVAAALAQSWNEELLYAVGCAVQEEMKEYGCTFWLAPAINIHRNPLCGRNFEYFSEDPFLSGALASALIRGVQREEGYYVTVKHFACNNQEDNRNKVSSNLSERALREIYLRGFEAAVRKGGAKAIMTSYNKLNGVYTADSYDLCTKVLRNEWGFEGVVMTDWYSTMLAKDASVEAIRAGNDLIMPGEPLSKLAIVSAVKKGKLSEADLKRCCCNVVRAVMHSAIQKEYIG